MSKGILSKSRRCCVSDGGGERLKKEGKTAGDILHDRLTSRSEGRKGRSIGAEGPNGAANSHREGQKKKERWERASERTADEDDDAPLDLLKHELADRPTGNAR